MSAPLVGYARCSTDQQDLTAQRDALAGLGVEAERIYVPITAPSTSTSRGALCRSLDRHLQGLMPTSQAGCFSALRLHSV